MTFCGNPPPPIQTLPPLSLFFSPLLSPPPLLSLLARASASPPHLALRRRIVSPAASPSSAPSLRLPVPRLPLSPLPARGPSSAVGPPALDLARACSARQPVTPRRGGPGRARARHRRPRQARPTRSRAGGGRSCSGMAGGCEREACAWIPCCDASASTGQVSARAPPSPPAPVPASAPVAARLPCRHRGGSAWTSSASAATAGEIRLRVHELHRLRPEHASRCRDCATSCSTAGVAA